MKRGWQCESFHALECAIRTGFVMAVFLLSDTSEEDIDVLPAVVPRVIVPTEL